MEERAGRILFDGMLRLAPLVLAAACFSAPVPMTYVRHDLGDARCLVVLLPGAFDDADDFVGKGFVAALRAAGLSDVIATNATLGYYMKGMMPEQLFADVVRPLRRGRRLWLIGMSMGGLGALMSAQRHPDEIAGVIALAPYLGRDETIDAIRAAGGLQAWTPPPAATPTADNYDAQLWRWLQAATAGTTPAPEIYLGWGRKDRLGQVDSLLARWLPQDHVFLTDGGHDWGPWRRLLGAILPAVEKDCEVTSQTPP
jgi:pimeloyl-ACP methyl ester carboxylesterase